MAFKMGGWAASSSHIPFKKHGEPPHPDTGKVEYDDERSSEYVTFGGVPVYGNWNEVSGVTGGKNQTIPTNVNYPVKQENKYFNEKTGMENVQTLDWEEYDRIQSEGLTRENPEDEQQSPGPTREQVGPRNL